MEFFKQDSKIDFMGMRRWTATFSTAVFILSFASLLFYGLHWGLDFTGGTQVEVSYPQPANLQKIREQLAAGGFKEAVVISYGASTDVLISIAPQKNVNQTALVDKLMTRLPGAMKLRSEVVGAQVGKEMMSKGFLAVLVSVLATMIYIAMRFEYRFALSAAAALIHDPLLILGIFSFYQIDFDLKALAALLAVIGYSLNDTIVVFDRVRENFRRLRKHNAVDVMNISINQTLSRTIMTSALTLIVVIALFLYGGETMRGFSLALIIGIVIGTYSSIYVAGALAISLGLNRHDLMVAASQQSLVDNSP